MDDLSVQELDKNASPYWQTASTLPLWEFHKRRMASKGYRLENRIAGHHFYIWRIQKVQTACSMGMSNMQ